MKSFGISGLAAGLVGGLLAALLPLSAGAHDPVGIHAVFLTVSNTDRKAAPRDSTVEICRAALAHELQEQDLHVTESRTKSDAEVVVAGNYLTITEGPSSKIGEVLLNYTATLKDRTGRSRFTHVGDEWGDSAVDACQEAAEDIAEEISDAVDDLNDD